MSETVVPLRLTDDAALKIIRQAVKAGRVIFTFHAIKRMEQRKIDRSQIYDCLAQGSVTESVHKDIGTGNWQMTLSRFNGGQPVTVPVAIKYKSNGEHAIVITAYR